MTEDEYVKVRSLSAINVCLNILAEIIPENLNGIVNKKEYSQVMQNLYKWQDILFGKIKIEINNKQ